MFRIPRPLLLGLALMPFLPVVAQCDRWQQRVKYTMDVDLDPSDHRFTGTARLVYTNNSPDTLRELFFHLYLNAFRPGSEMDVRSRTIEDPDSRVGARIAALSPSEVGELTVIELRQDGRSAELQPMGTVLKVKLPKPLLPRKSTTLESYVPWAGACPSA
jgi:hypothetical protein